MDEERLSGGVAFDGKDSAPSDAVNPEIVFARLMKCGKIEFKHFFTGEGRAVGGNRIGAACGENPPEDGFARIRLNKFKRFAGVSFQRHGPGGSEPGAEIGVTASGFKRIANLVPFKKRGNSSVRHVRIDGRSAIGKMDFQLFPVAQGTVELKEEMICDFGVPGGETVDTQKSGRIHPESRTDDFDRSGSGCE